jgi:hypothetical protein
MTRATLMGDFCHELILRNMLYLMGRMTVFAIGEFLVCFGYAWTVNAVLKIFIDAFVAYSTGCRKIFVVNG